MLLLVVLACEPKEAAKPPPEDTDTAADPPAPAVAMHVEGTVAGAAYVFDCGADAVAYTTFPEGAGWFSSLSCRKADASEWVDVVATDAEVGHVYGAADAASFNAFRVVLDGGATQYGYDGPTAYALTFTRADVQEDGVTLAGTFSGGWADAELTGEFEGFAPLEAR